MRIAVTSYYLPSGSKIGAGYMAHHLAEAVVALGHEVTMFSPCPKPDGATYEHCQLALAGHLRTFRWGMRVARLELSGFDILHCHGDNHLRAPWCSPPVVRTMHGSCFSEALRIKGIKERVRMLALGITEVFGSITARRTVAVSMATRRVYPWISTVIPNGVDLARYRPGRKDPAPTVLFVGTYRRRKRGKLLMEVFEREIRPAFPDAVLWMVCSDAPEAPGVEILGRLSNDELADRYRRAWAFCLPSSYEGFGVPYIEAMASGTAVVATPNPGAMEILDGGRLGVVCDPADLGGSISNLLAEPNRRDVLETSGLEAARQYDWNEVAARYIDIYRELQPSGEAR